MTYFIKKNKNTSVFSRIVVHISKFYVQPIMKTCLTSVNSLQCPTNKKTVLVLCCITTYFGRYYHRSFGLHHRVDSVYFKVDRRFRNIFSSKVSRKSVK